MPSSSPVLFKDRLSDRAAPNGQMRIGNPYAWLNTIGIAPILEELCRGNNIVDVASTLNVSITVLTNWVEQEGYSVQVDKAITFSAEGYVSQARKLIKAADNDFQLRKATLLTRHSEFMASKVNKPKFGGEMSKAPSGGVTFIMHMGDETRQVTARVVDNSAPIAPMPKEIQNNVLEGTYAITPSWSINEEAAEPDEVGPFEPEPFIPIPSEAPEGLDPMNPLCMFENRY